VHFYDIIDSDGSRAGKPHGVIMGQVRHEPHATGPDPTRKHQRQICSTACTTRHVHELRVA